MRRLSYAATFTNPVKAGTIRSIEWLTGKMTLMRLVRRFERDGIPQGTAFFPAAMQNMGIDVRTPAHQVAHIPQTGPVVVVANHPHGLVDGLVLGDLVGRRRSDFKILTRSLMTGVPAIERFMVPVPFPHEKDARALGLEMRRICMEHLGARGAIVLFPSGKVATSETMFGPVVEPEWSLFTAKMILKSQATVVPVYFPGANTRVYHMADKIAATFRQGLLLHEICRSLNKPQDPVIGAAIPPEVYLRHAESQRSLIDWLRAKTLGLANPPE